MVLMILVMLSGCVLLPHNDVWKIAEEKGYGNVFNARIDGSWTATVLVLGFGNSEENARINALNQAITVLPEAASFAGIKVLAQKSTKLLLRGMWKVEMLVVVL